MVECKQTCESDQKRIQETAFWQKIGTSMGKEKYEQRHGEKKQVERNRLAPIPAQETEPCPGYAACGAGNPQNTVEWTAEKTFPRQQAKDSQVHT
jgi:hypothetical protein